MVLFSTSGSVPVMAPLVLIIALFLFGNIPLGNTQLLSNQLVSLQERDNAFESVSGKFNITVPDGWVIQDVYNTDTISLLEEMMQGSRLLAQICPRDQAIAHTEGTYSCEESAENISIQQYPNLADQREFGFIDSNNIRNENLLNYHIMKLHKLGYSEISILRNTNMTINVINSDTNKTTVAVVPASLLEMRYDSPNSTDTRGYVMLSATNATSHLGIISGYSLSYEANAATLPSIFPPEPILRIFQSFELVKGPGEGGLGALNVEDNDYGNDAFTSIGRPTREAEHLLSPSLGSTEETINQTEAAESCKPLTCFRDRNQ
jgi:hypothetical protein